MATSFAPLCPGANWLRHCAGPTTSEAVFLNHEELSVHVIYRDPVHDFAFLRCDLAALKVRAQAPAAQAQPYFFWRCASAGG